MVVTKDFCTPTTVFTIHTEFNYQTTAPQQKHCDFTKFDTMYIYVNVASKYCDFTNTFTCMVIITLEALFYTKRFYLIIFEAL